MILLTEDQDPVSNKKNTFSMNLKTKYNNSSYKIIVDNKPNEEIMEVTYRTAKENMQEPSDSDVPRHGVFE